MMPVTAGRGKAGAHAGGRLSDFARLLGDPHSLWGQDVGSAVRLPHQGLTWSEMTHSHRRPENHFVPWKLIKVPRPQPSSTGLAIHPEPSYGHRTWREVTAPSG